MKNKLVNFFGFIGLDYKKEILKLCIIDGFCIVFSILFLFIFKIIYLSLFILLILFAVDYLYYSNYLRLRDDVISSRENEFVSVISYFQIFILNKKNVYCSFQLITPYCSSWMKDKLDTLLTSIDEDKSVKPFVTFAENFKISLANNIMLAIYQMVDHGNTSEQLNQFIVLFDQLSRAHLKQQVDKKERSLDNIGIYALIGAGGVVVLLMFGILSIMGDLINVI